jgi:hypothetical protein
MDPQDPEVLCDGLCYECNAARWNEIKSSLTLDNISKKLSKMNVNSNWYRLYHAEYKARLNK